MCTVISHLPKRTSVPVLCSLILSMSLVACGGGTGSSITPPTTAIGISGKTSFVSADTWSSISVPTKNTETSGDKNVSLSGANGGHTIIEGDIYRVLDSGKTVLNLNPSRGLQIIDIQNPDAPKMLGRAPINGSPVEMYVLGNRVYALLNDWTEYKPVLKAGKEVMDSFHGGAVITIDISSRSAPKIINTQRLGGYVLSSRVASGTGKSALYVAAQVYEGNSSYTLAKSFAINTQGDLMARDSISIPGYSNTMQVSNDRFLIANLDYSNSRATSTINILDISSPDGVMISGTAVTPSGVVLQKNNMHVQGNILRIVSANSWNSTSNTNHVETFNIADMKRPVAVDHVTFGAGQQLFGTTFMADKAFFVTYLRKDPFHAFSITADGKLREESEYVVSGWNDFFTPVKSNTRLIGVGHNDQNNARALSISLYDASNLQNKQPLVARADMDLTYSWSEANWDDRAFTVIDDAVNIVSADGKNTETGLVMLPFSGWHDSTQTYQSGVQLFSFSANSITRRGIMKQESQVRRSAAASENLAVNLSDSQMTLFGTTNLNTPLARGNLSLVSNYSQFVAFSNLGVRYKTTDFSWWGSNSAAQRNDTLEFVGINDVDNNTPVASMSVPEGSKIFNLNGRLVIFSSIADGDVYHSTISNYDVSNPAAPRLLGTVKTDAIKPGGRNINIYLDKIMCIRDRCGGYATFDVRVVGNSLLFSNQTWQYTPLADTNIGTRSFSNFSFVVVDLSNSSSPTVLPQISMGKDEEAVGLTQAGNSIWVNYKKPQAGGSVNQGLAKYYVKELNLTTPSNNKFGTEINIPGQLLSVVGDKFYTIENTWKGTDLLAALNMLIVQNDLAYLQASYDLSTQYTSSLVVDGNTVAMSSYDNANYQRQITLLNVSSKEFTKLSTIDLDDVGEVKSLRQGRLMLQNSYGIFLYDVSQPSVPSARAFFPARTWYGDISIFNNDIFLPANTFGIYQFNWNTINLTRT